MTHLRSRIPRVDGMDEILRRYLEDLDRRIPARDDIATGAAVATVVTAINDLFADLRDAGLMEE